jgi:capsular polysaccharide biosynthesis protein
VKRQGFGLRPGAAALRRRWRVAALAGAVGLVLGAGYVVLVPPLLTSTALVLLPPPENPQQDTSTGSTTQLTIALSTVVLGRAGAAVRPALSARVVADQVGVTAPTDLLLQVQASATSGRTAQALAQAVAEAYVTTVRDAARTLSATTMRDLRTREATLSNQVNGLQSEIDATIARQRADAALSAESRKDAQLLAQLRAGQASLSLELDRVKDAMFTSEARGSASEAATTIIQPAAPATGPALVSRLLAGGGSGLLLAVLGVAVVLLVRARGDLRLRTRDDLADAVGSPVLASVAGRAQDSVAGWSALLETAAVEPVEEWAFRQALKSLAGRRPGSDPPARPGDGGRSGPRPADPARPAHPPAVTVLSLAGDEGSASVGPQLAVFAASRGIATRLVAAAGRDHAPALWAACSGVRVAGARAHLELAAPGPEPDPGADGAGPAPAVARLDPLRSAELTVVLAVVDPARPQLAGIPVTPVTLLAIAPGVATRVDLARLAVAVDDGGRRLDGVIVAGPDPGDPTTGRHTLDRRIRQWPLPVRLTGPASPAAPGAGRRDRP